ncbi:MAG TPA: hypothetical protein VEK07_06250 [Polyangiaceae bacterium]|nr:hypothetical protein [Polyangiaceae bacterium]
MTQDITVQALRVRPGVIDAALGDLGGAVGVARRSFEVDGIEYVDIDLSAETLDEFAMERRQSFYDKKIVFTRVRMNRRNVEPYDLPLNPIAVALYYRRRAERVDAISREWYERVGNAEQDPTADAVDLAARVSRRRALLVAAGLGAVAVGVVASAINSCESAISRSGSWDRADGGSVGYGWHGGYGGGGYGGYGGGFGS